MIGGFWCCSAGGGCRHGCRQDCRQELIPRQLGKVPDRQDFVSVCITVRYVADELFDLDLLDEEDPFEINAQAAHLFKHPRLGIEDIREVWASDPMFYPAKPPAHWLMVAEVDGTVLMVPLAPARDGNPKRCRPIGCYEASKQLADQYRRDR